MACIGAGNLTKGLLFPLFYAAGYDITILTITENSAKIYASGYVLNEVSETIIRREYAGFRICPITDFEKSEFASFQIITTAVGKNNILCVADILSKKELHPNLQFFLCENDIECYKIIHPIIHNVYPTIVDRIVYSQTHQNIFAEKYFSFQIFKKPISPSLPSFITECANFEESYFKKKYLVNTLHTIIAWHAYIKNIRHINIALQEQDIYDNARAVAKELIAILCHKFPFTSPKLFQNFSAQSFDRFRLKGLYDPVERVGRNALTKLGRDERVMEPVRYARKHGLSYRALLKSAAFGILFHADMEESHFSQNEDIFSYI